MGVDNDDDQSGGAAGMSHVDDFTAFARSQLPALYRTAYLLTHDQYDAEDLVQETLAKVFVVWRKKRLDNPAGYAYVALTRTFISGRRRRRTVDPGAARAGSFDAGSVPLQVDLMTAIAQLDAHDRAVLVLRYLMDYSVEQTADALRLSPGAVKTRTHRAAVRLRDVLGSGYAKETRDA